MAEGHPRHPGLTQTVAGNEQIKKEERGGNRSVQQSNGKIICVS